MGVRKSLGVLCFLVGCNANASDNNGFSSVWAFQIAPETLARGSRPIETRFASIPILPAHNRTNPNLYPYSSCFAQTSHLQPRALPFITITATVPECDGRCHGGWFCSKVSITPTAHRSGGELSQPRQHYSSYVEKKCKSQAHCSYHCLLTLTTYVVCNEGRDRAG